MRPGRFTFVQVDESVGLGGGVDALIAEREGTTAVLSTDAADERGWTYDFQAAWLTLEVHSTLDAVGLTAAVSAALAQEGISCNVLAGFFHDHLLVPADRVDDAVRCLESLNGAREIPIDQDGSTG